MASTTFYLEHFYYGQIVQRGQPQGDLRLLAKSPGVSDEFAVTAVNQVMLPAQPGTLAWALTRGRQMSPLLVQAQRGQFGQTMLHYILMPPEALRTMGGDLSTLMALVEEAMPVYDQLGDALLLLELAEAAPPSPETQVENILELMTAARNRMPIMEALLSAIVQGVPLVIASAPPDLRQRVRFIEGLLALLPPSTRFGITFATHTLASTRLDVQIRFLDDDVSPDEALVYNWMDASISGRQVEDEYSHFIISQLRLDAELVIQQTEALTPVAGWRVRQGDRLRDALAYASNRRKLDEALLHNQPVEIADMSRTLAEDPTLTDELRTAYTRHLLAFALALGEVDHAQPIAAQVQVNAELARAALQQLDEAILDGKAGVVYAVLSRWMADPAGPQGVEWAALAQKAALASLAEQVEAQNLPAVQEFLVGLLRADPGISIRPIVPKVVEVLMPLTARDTALAEYVFVLAATYLETGALKKLLETGSFVARLPKQVGAFQQYLSNHMAASAPAGLLMTAARAFEEEWQPVIVLRLAELALSQARAELLDTPALSGILQAALSPRSTEYGGVLWSIVKHFAEVGLATLEDPGPRYLLQILLALGEYRQLAYEMIRQSRELYPGDLQPRYIAMVQRLFAETPLKPEQALQALQVVYDEGIRAAPYVAAATGALEAAEWSPALRALAENVARMLFENPKYTEVMSAESILALLTYHVQQQDVADTIRVASLAPIVAAYQETGGLEVMSRMYRLMDWENRVRLAALDLLRRYIRKAPDAEARQGVAYLGRELGAEVLRSLEVTYTFKRVMAGHDIITYAARLHATAQFLYDSAATYADRGRYPLVDEIISTLRGMAGSIPHDERPRTGEHLLSAGRAIVALQRQFRAHSPRNLDQHIDQILAGQADPSSALDVLRAMGGYFTRGKRFYLKLDPVSSAFGDRSAPHLQEDIEFAHELLSSAAQTFPADRPVKLTVWELRAELDSIWGDLSTDQQRRLVRNLAIDLHRIPELAAIIAESGDARALESGGLGEKLDAGRQQPRSALEFYRFLSGYWKSGR